MRWTLIRNKFEDQRTVKKMTTLEGQKMLRRRVTFSNKSRMTRIRGKYNAIEYNIKYIED